MELDLSLSHSLSRSLVLSFLFAVSKVQHQEDTHKNIARVLEQNRERVYIFKSKDLARAGEINARIY